MVDPVDFGVVEGSTISGKASSTMSEVVDLGIGVGRRLRRQTEELIALVWCQIRELVCRESSLTSMLSVECSDFITVLNESAFAHSKLLSAGVGFVVGSGELEEFKLILESLFLWQATSNGN